MGGIEERKRRNRENELEESEKEIRRMKGIGGLKREI